MKPHPRFADAVAPESDPQRQAELEHRLEAFRMVLLTMLAPEDLDDAARLLEASLSVDLEGARRLLGLPGPGTPHSPLESGADASPVRSTTMSAASRGR
jgi:hypothetical protein